MVIAGSVKLMKGKLSKFFFQQRNRVLEQLEKETAKLTPDMERKAVDDVFNLAGENEKLLARLKPMLVADLEFGGAQLFAELGMDNFQLKPQAALDFLKVRENYIKEINQTTFDQITTSLREGLDEGESYEKLAARVKEALGTASGLHAKAIAVETYEGRVQLSGFVNTPEEKAKAEQIARTVNGVMNVQNNITVK